MYSLCNQYFHGPTPISIPLLEDGLVIRPPLLGVSASKVLPYEPIWPGFAINTVFYALGGWLLFAGPFVVRRWRRIRRGLCPKCAYDLRGSDSPACPECGATK